MSTLFTLILIRDIFVSVLSEPELIAYLLIVLLSRRIFDYRGCLVEKLPGEGRTSLAIETRPAEFRKTHPDLREKNRIRIRPWRKKPTLKKNWILILPSFCLIKLTLYFFVLT